MVFFIHSIRMAKVVEKLNLLKLLLEIFIANHLQLLMIIGSLGLLTFFVLKNVVMFLVDHDAAKANPLTATQKATHTLAIRLFRKHKLQLVLGTSITHKNYTGHV
jgi:hypothetical protein